MSTDIAWCDETWNVVTGCTPVSESCQNCYAEAMTRRFWKKWGCEPPPNHFKVKFHPDRLDQPLHWKKPRKIFVCSMSDLLHETNDIYRIAAVVQAMQAAPQHTYIVLTKRADRLARWLGNITMPNLWLGVTAENQQRFDERVSFLMGLRAGVRFVCLEPMLGPIDMEKAGTDWWESGNLNWVILGAESGPRRRPCKLEWMVDVVKQCQAAGVRVFVKQVPVPAWMPRGSRGPPTMSIAEIDTQNHCHGWRVSHNPVEWPSALRVREYPHE